jgi:hypothetical protein
MRAWDQLISLKNRRASTIQSIHQVEEELTAPTLRTCTPELIDSMIDYSIYNFILKKLRSQSIFIASLPLLVIMCHPLSSWNSSMIKR